MYAKLKKSISIILILIIGITVAGCEKSESKKEKSADEFYYQSSIEETFDYGIEKTLLEDNVIYSVYSQHEAYDLQGLLEGREPDFHYGIVKYNLDTKEKKETVLDIDGYVGNMYFNAKDELCVQVFDDVSAMGGHNINHEENDYAEKIYVYNKNLDLIAQNEVDEKSKLGVRSTIICENESIIKFLSDGETSCEIVVEDDKGDVISEISFSGYGGQLLSLSKDKTALLLWTNTGTEIYMPDMKKGELGDRLEGTEDFYNVSGIGVGLQGKLLISDSDYLYEYDEKKKEAVAILRWLDSDISPESVNSVYQSDTETYGVVITDYDGKWAEIDSLKKRDIADREEREEIVFATWGKRLDEINEFNRTNDKYRIVVVDYIEGMINENKGMYEQFEQDILSGNIPDMIDLEYLDIAKYGELGLFEDLMPYLENDSDLSVDDLLEAPLNACKTNGKLYAIPTYFGVEMWAGNSNEVGVDIHWTADEFIEYANSLPDIQNLYGSATKEQTLNYLILNDLKSYIDWESGSCNFNSENFIHILEFCNQFISGEELVADMWANGGHGEVESSVGKVALNNVILLGIRDYMNDKAIYGENLSYKGYPAKEGSGLQIYSSTLIGIGSNSKYKEVIWEFLKQYYTYEKQSESINWAFPIRKDVYDELLEQFSELKPITEGDKTYYYKMKVSDNVYCYVEEFSNRDIERIRDIVDNTDRMRSSIDEEIYSIILEEADVFFEGEKSAKEVAEIIQSRVSLYVKEHS